MQRFHVFYLLFHEDNIFENQRELIPSQEFSISALCWGLLVFTCTSLVRVFIGFAYIKGMIHSSTKYHWICWSVTIMASRIQNSPITSWTVFMPPFYDHSILAGFRQARILHHSSTSVPNLHKMESPCYRIHATLFIKHSIFGFHLIPLPMY